MIYESDLSWMIWTIWYVYTCIYIHAVNSPSDITLPLPGPSCCTMYHPTAWTGDRPIQGVGHRPGRARGGVRKGPPPLIRVGEVEPP